MQIMSEATQPLRSYQPFIDWMAHMESPWLAIAAAAAFTGVIQSSAATAGVVIVLAGSGLVSLQAGIALIFGANIGTCVTAMLASIGKPREAVRAAIAHVIFNVAGVLMWLKFIPELAEITRFISPSAPELHGLERLAAEVPRQVANAHTVFNVANTLIFIWFVTPLAWIIQKMIPVKTVPEDRGKPRYLDPVLMSTPALALDRSRRELGRMGDMVAEMVDSTSNLHSLSEVDRLRKTDDEVDRLHIAIIGYLSELSRRGLSEQQSVELSSHLLVANYFENIGDMVETNLVSAATEMMEVPLEPSPQTAELLDRLRSEVVAAVLQASQAFCNNDVGLAQDVVEEKQGINEIAAQLEDRLASRLVAEAPHRLDAFRLESELVEYLKRVYYFAKRIAKVILPES
jgi:phosphate:Na+ symporter